MKSCIEREGEGKPTYFVRDIRFALIVPDTSTV
jgi:hypothetical protein